MIDAVADRVYGILCVEPRSCAVSLYEVIPGFDSFLIVAMQLDEPRVEGRV